MPDNLKLRHPEDGKRLSDQAHEIKAFLDKHPEISAMTLKQAKDAVGDSYEKIEQWLKNKGYLK